jgi:hypothetical protein
MNIDTYKLTDPQTAPLVPPGWNPKDAGDRVMAGLRNICLPKVKGAHDVDFVIHCGKAYVVYMANDIQPGEKASWPYVYSAFSIVDTASGRVERTVTFAESEKAYGNETLPPGACFVPRVIQKDERTLRLFFASEQPGERESQCWYLDFDLPSGEFDWNIHRAEIETSRGIFPMQTRHFYEQGCDEGFAQSSARHGLYLIDSFKRFDGRIYAVVNNFAIGQNAWAEVNAELTRFTILGNIFPPGEEHLTEAAVNRLPDGSWLAIVRQDRPRGTPVGTGGNFNYMFSRSRDGREWTTAWYRPELVPNGGSSKPTFDRFGDLYYLGWQESTLIDGVSRSVFNVDVSRDGRTWERKYRFETSETFQYPVFREHEGAIWLCATQGRKERIMFGKLEDSPV